MKSIFQLTILTATCVLALTAAVPSAGQWVENGTPICTDPEDQRSMDIVRLENGLTVVVWNDNRGSGTSIYAQCFDPSGNMLWPMNGAPVCTVSSTKYYPEMVADGAEGVIITWGDDRSGNQDIYAQRLDINGDTLWVSGGVAICSAANNQGGQKLVADGYGGAIITWHDERYGVSDHDIFVQRVDSAGSVQWTIDGIGLNTLTWSQMSPAIVTDGDHGAVISWEDHTENDIEAQRIGNNGAIQWQSGGVTVTSAVYVQQDPTMIPDGYGGAIIVWQDTRSDGVDSDIYAQRMSGAGTALWLNNGIALCTASGDQYMSEIVTDCNGGAIVSWSDERSGDSDIYVQRVNRNGLIQWTSDGIAACSVTGIQYNYGAVSNDYGGIIIAIEDYRNGDSDIYAQRVASNGSLSWAAEGVPLCDYPEDQDLCVICPDGSGGAIVSWADVRSSTSADLYAQRIGRNGFWGYPCPLIFEVADVPNDQGGRLTLTWEASRLDRYNDHGIEYYSVWRQLGAIEMQALINAGIVETSPARIEPDFEGEAIRFAILEGVAYGFEWLENVDAHFMEIYSYAAETLNDSTASDPGLHTFMVSAHYSSEAFWDSPPVTGYSVDNLSPCMPLALAGEQSFVPAGVILTWSPNSESDLDGYNIYRGVGESFVPGLGNLLATTCDTLVFDGDWSWDSGYCYKVAAVDIHGNESEYAVLCAGDITGDDPQPIPGATFLSQNYPNPFNPNTVIAFGLKDGGHVSLRIYDAAGRLVATLVDETRPTGYFTVEWNGCRSGERGIVGSGADGSTAASGVYFYRLTAGDFVETKKMILLK